MAWSDLQRVVPSPEGTHAAKRAQRYGSGAGPFGVPDVGLPSLTWLSGDLATRARAGSTSGGGFGLPDSRFLQQPPGSLSFLDSAVDAGTRTVPPDVKVAVPPTEPLWRLGPGGGVAPGLRTPFGPVHAPRPFVGWTSALPEITRFDPQWGEPPMLPGLVWSTERLLYEPDTEGMRFAKGAQRLFYDHYVTMANSQAYVQAYRQSSGTGSWAYRWVRATTPLPSTTAPYEILGSYDRYKLDLERRPDYGPTISAARGGETTSSLAGAKGLALPSEAARGGGASLPALGGTKGFAASSEGPLAARGYSGPEIEIHAQGHEQPPAERPISDYTWVPQNMLPAGCPYSEPYLPVPLSDYTSGRWLEPDYVPSYPLPRPYDQLPPWQCGVPAIAGSGKGKAGKPPPMTKYTSLLKREALEQMTLEQLEARQRQLMNEHGDLFDVDANGELIVRAGELSASEHFDLEELKKIAKLIPVKKLARASQALPGDPVAALADLQSKVQALREELRDSPLTAELRKRLEADLVRATKDLLSTTAHVRNLYDTGKLPSLPPEPADFDRNAMVEILQNRADQIQQEMRNPGGQKRASELQDELGQVDRALRELGAGRALGWVPEPGPGAAPGGGDAPRAGPGAGADGAKRASDLESELESLLKKLSRARDAEEAFRLQTQIQAVRGELDRGKEGYTVSQVSKTPRPAAPPVPSEKKPPARPPSLGAGGPRATERKLCDEVLQQLNSRLKALNELQGVFKEAGTHVSTVAAGADVRVHQTQLAGLLNAQAGRADSVARVVSDAIGRAKAAIRKGDLDACRSPSLRRAVARADLVALQSPSVIIAARAYLEHTKAKAKFNMKLGLLISAIVTGGLSLAAEAALGTVVKAGAWELLSVGITGPAQARISAGAEEVLKEALTLAEAVSDDESERILDREAKHVADIVAEMDDPGPPAPAPAVPPESSFFLSLDQLARLNADLTGTQNDVAARIAADRSFAEGWGGAVDTAGEWVSLGKAGWDIVRGLAALGAAGYKKLRGALSQTVESAPKKPSTGTGRGSDPSGKPPGGPTKPPSKPSGVGPAGGRGDPSKIPPHPFLSDPDLRALSNRVLKGEAPRSAMSAEARAKLADWFEHGVAPNVAGNKADSAQLFNVDRARYLRGEIDSPPGGLNDWMDAHGIK